MSKRCFIISLLLLCAWSLSAQKPFRPTVRKAKVSDGIVYGIKIGANSSRLYYTNPHLSVLPHDLMIGPSGSVFVEIPFLKLFSVAPEVNIQQKGGATSYVYEENYHVEYKLKATCVSVRLPLLVYIPISKYIKPYVFGAAEISKVVGGSISLSQPGLEIPSVTLPILESDMRDWNWGPMVGAGLRVNLPLPHLTLVLKLEAAYNSGMTDTFSSQEHDETAIPTNVHAYNHQGARFIKGLELNLGVGFTPAKKSVCDQFGPSYKSQVISYD